MYLGIGGYTVGVSSDLNAAKVTEGIVKAAAHVHIHLESEAVIRRVQRGIQRVVAIYRGCQLIRAAPRVTLAVPPGYSGDGGGKGSHANRSFTAMRTGVLPSCEQVFTAEAMGTGFSPPLE